jgi:hypothetical protein
LTVRFDCMNPRQSRSVFRSFLGSQRQLTHPQQMLSLTPQLPRLQEISLHDTLPPSLPIQRPGLVTRELSATAPHSNCRRFFSPGILSYGGCAWDVFGRAGFLDSRFTNLRTAATHSLGNEKVAVPRQGARPCAIQIRTKFRFSLNAISSRALKTSPSMEVAND